MKVSTRYGLMGIGALGALSLVHWGRKAQYDGADQNPGATYAAARRCFVVVTLVAGVALIAWEFKQPSSRTLVFDSHDIGATILGLGAGWFLFTLLTPKS